MRAPQQRTIGQFDCYTVFDGNSMTATALMLPAGTSIRRVEVA